MMEHVAHLCALPDGFDFPVGLWDKIQFDPVRQQLIFQGNMSKNDYEILIGLHPAAHYQRAINDLFHTSISQRPHVQQFGLILVGLTVACVLFAGYVWWTILQPVPDSQRSDAGARFNRSAQFLHRSHWKR